MNTTEDIIGASHSAGYPLVLQAVGHGTPSVNRGSNPLTGTGTGTGFRGIVDTSNDTKRGGSPALPLLLSKAGPDSMNPLGSPSAPQSTANGPGPGQRSTDSVNPPALFSLVGIHAVGNLNRNKIQGRSRSQARCLVADADGNTFCIGGHQEAEGP